MSKSEIKINIEKGKIFKGWIYERFPFIQEDFDSLTSYELWCKVVEYLNKTISAFNDNFENTINAFNELQNYVNENVQNLIDDFNNFKSDMNTLYNEFTTNLVSEFNTFKSGVNTEVSTFESNMTASFNTLSDNFTALETYVNNYFNNLDVQDEIDNKLDKMAEDGVFDELIESQIIPQISDFMNSFGIAEKTFVLNSGIDHIDIELPSGFNEDSIIMNGNYKVTGDMYSMYDFENLAISDMSLIYSTTTQKNYLHLDLKSNWEQTYIGTFIGESLTIKYLVYKVPQQNNNQ